MHIRTSNNQKTPSQGESYFKQQDIRTNETQAYERKQNVTDRQIDEETKRQGKTIMSSEMTSQI